jgi:hypothetical protein
MILVSRFVAIMNLKARKAIEMVDIKDNLSGLMMLCPACKQKINKPLEAYIAKPIPVKMMQPGNRPSCQVPKCKRVGQWNVNNGNVVCQDHFIVLASQGIPVIIIAKSLLENHVHDDVGKMDDSTIKKLKDVSAGNPPAKTEHPGSDEYKPWCMICICGHCHHEHVNTVRACIKCPDGVCNTFTPMEKDE